MVASTLRLFSNSYLYGIKISEAWISNAALSILTITLTLTTRKLISSRNRQAMFSISEPLRSIVHAARVLEDGILRTMTSQQCATEFAPKVQDAWHLHQLTQGMDLGMFLLFSSISGIVEMPGQANYAAANTFLDALARLRHARNLPASSIAYGSWGGEGMASRLSRIHVARFSQMGLDMLDSDHALKLTARAIRNGRPITVLARVDPGRLRDYFLNLDQDGTPALFRTMLDQGSQDNRSSDQAASTGHSLHEILDHAISEQRLAIVLSMVRATVAKALGFAQPDDVDVTKPLQDIGIDSLTAVLMRN
jgi:hypothetical protein